MPTGTDAGENLATSDWLLAAADAEPSAAESEPAVQRAGLVGVTGAHAEPVLKIDPFTYWLYVTKFEFRAKLAAGEVNCAAQLLPGGAHCAPCTILTGTLAAMQVNKRVSLFTFIVLQLHFLFNNHQDLPGSGLACCDINQSLGLLCLHFGQHFACLWRQIQTTTKK